LRAWLRADAQRERHQNKPLTEEQKVSNQEKFRTRCRVEHIFGAMESRARDEIMRCIGMRNLVYNLS
jgi:hypothetical protein